MPKASIPKSLSFVAYYPRSHNQPCCWIIIRKASDVSANFLSVLRVKDFIQTIKQESSRSGFQPCGNCMLVKPARYPRSVLEIFEEIFGKSVFTV